jgi:protein gp37
MRNSHIAWTDDTFNPWWGCEKVSAGCQLCYADTMSRRFGHQIWGKDAPRRFLSDANWGRPVKWNDEAIRTGVPRRVFCASMADVFEDRRDLDASRERLWALMAQTPALDWQLLTKRPENISRMVPLSWMRTWPAHVWIGTTTENQALADRRIPALLKIPASVRFLSVEPLVGPIPALPLDGIHWVLVAGESGSKARAMDLSWARAIRDRCADADVAFFVKQLGGRPGSTRGELEQMPEDLRIREYPRGTLLRAEAA